MDKVGREVRDKVCCSDLSLGCFHGPFYIILSPLVSCFFFYFRFLEVNMYRDKTPRRA